MQYGWISAKCERVTTGTGCFGAVLVDASGKRYAAGSLSVAPTIGQSYRFFYSFGIVCDLRVVA